MWRSMSPDGSLAHYAILYCYDEKTTVVLLLGACRYLSAGR